jgi:hypothetical protein
VSANRLAKSLLKTDGFRFATDFPTVRISFPTGGKTQKGVPFARNRGWKTGKTGVCAKIQT